MPATAAQFPLDGNVTVQFPAYLTQHAPRCVAAYAKRPKCEPMLRRLANKLLPLLTGHVVDCGCWLGDNSVPWALSLAALGRTSAVSPPRGLERHVLSFDPNPANIDFVANLSAANELTNLKLHLGVLSLTPKINSPWAGSRRFTLDQVASTSVGPDEPIGFIHLDTNGNEEAVLRGGARVIARDHPVILTEDESGPGLARLRRVRAFLEPQGYVGRQLDEVCGEASFCRNWVWTHTRTHAGAVDSAVSEIVGSTSSGTATKWCGVGDPGFYDRKRRTITYNRGPRFPVTLLGVRCGGE